MSKMSKKMSKNFRNNLCKYLFFFILFFFVNGLMCASLKFTVTCAKKV